MPEPLNVQLDEWQVMLPTCDKTSWWRRKVTIGDLTFTLGQWRALSGIANLTICQRIERGVFPVQALITPNQAKLRLPLRIPPFPWRDKFDAFGDFVYLTLHQNGNREYGVEALYNTIFGDGGFCRFDDIFGEFQDDHRNRLIHLKEQAQACITKWQNLGRPCAIQLKMKATDKDLLTEVFLRRHSKYVRQDLVT